MNSWYAVYIRPQKEKRVKSCLEEKQLECYLPLRKSLRQWSDRKKWIEIPVITGYIFVNINSSQRLDVLKTDFVMGFVRYLGADAIIPENQINTMKCMLGQSEYDIEVDYTNYRKGQPVIVTAGPLTGLRGNLVLVKNKHKVIVSLEQINVNIIAELPAIQLEVAHAVAG